MSELTREGDGGIGEATWRGRSNKPTLGISQFASILSSETILHPRSSPAIDPF
jgi:hypothetical protein